MTKSPSAVSGKVASGRMSRRGGGTGPQPYDFRRPIKLSREHMRNLQMCFETYARSCGTLLTTRLRAVSQVGLLAIEQLTYEEYQTQLNNPTVLAVVTLEPLSGSILFEVPLSTAMASIDHLLGGPGGAQPERPLTDLEMPLLRGLLDKMLGELAYGLEAMVSVHPKLGAIEYNPQFVRTIAPGDAVVVTSFEIRVGSEESIASICIPFASILPVLEKPTEHVELTPDQRMSLLRAQANLAAGLSLAPLDVAVRFQPIRMRTDDIIDLCPGDVVPLGHPVTVPLSVVVNNTVFAHAVPGTQGARLACLIVPSPKEDSRK